MPKTENSKNIIYQAAKKLFWTRGYSNVSIRDISKESKTDNALISRYFGSKKKLFEETLTEAEDWFIDFNPDKIEDFLVDGLMENTNENDEVTLVRMLCMNAGDPEVGTLVKKFHEEKMRKPVLNRINKKIDTINYDLMGAIILGVSISRKILKNPGFTKLNDKNYEKVIRHLFKSALKYK